MIVALIAFASVACSTGEKEKAGIAIGAGLGVLPGVHVGKGSMLRPPCSLRLREFHSALRAVGDLTGSLREHEEKVERIETECAREQSRQQDRSRSRGFSR